MKKVQFHQFDPVIYPVKIWIVITNNIDVINERFHAYPNCRIEIDFKKFDAGSILVVNKETLDIGSLLIFDNKKSLKVQTLTHEAMHTARDIWQHLGEDEPGREAEAYLIGWITDCIWRVKNNKE